MSDTLETLRKAREIIADPAHWTKGYFAKDAEGRDVEPLALCATCFCSAGAILKAQGRTTYQLERDEMPKAALVELAKTVKPDGDFAQDAWATTIYRFNDHHTHAEVLDVFDRTIERLKNESARLDVA